MRYTKKFITLLFLFIIVGCYGFDLVIAGQDVGGYYDGEEKIDSLGFVKSNDVLQRAFFMSSVVWSPLKRIPLRNGVYYEPGIEVKGIPYSSVKEINTFLFQDVSYHTFMTAVNNPKSVLYTEDISQEPYHGLNCAPYYGAVCSSSIMYALGIGVPYNSYQIITLPFMRKIEPQVIDSLKVCDIIWKKGHVQMIFDTEFNADTLCRVTTFQSSGKCSYLKSFTKEQFLELWNRDGCVGYRYDNLRYSEEPATFREPENVEYNNDLCPSKGDRAVYRTDDEIVINIFNKEYDWIVLEKDNVVINTEKINGEDFLFQNLSAGIYYVYLQKENKKSLPVSFETIMTDVSVSIREGDNNMVVYFLTTGKADYVALCDLHGDSMYYPISDLDRNNGSIVVPKRDISEYYCKVVFKGDYGSIISRPIQIK